MKILFISNITGKRIGNFTLSSILAAKELGIEFHSVANRSLATAEDIAADEKKYGIKLHHIDFARNPFAFGNYKAFKQLMKLLKEENFDAIHCNTPTGGFLGRLCGTINRVPKIIYMAHGFHFYKGNSFLKNLIFKSAENIMARITDAIITINKEDYEAAKNFKLKKNGKVFLVPGIGINTSVIEQANSKRKEILLEIDASDEDILIISTGELNNNKNNEVVIKALGKLQNKKIHYLLCGAGQKKDDLIYLAKRNNIDRNVHFLGYRTDIAELLKSCDIFVMMSYREGLSRSIMEAMSSGLPCIVSDIRGNLDLIDNGRGGYFRNPEDIDGLSVDISTLAGDINLRISMGNYNINRVKEFDLENVKLEIKKIYSDILKIKSI